VLVQPGVTHAIVMLGTNDLRNRWARVSRTTGAVVIVLAVRRSLQRSPGCRRFPSPAPPRWVRFAKSGTLCEGSSLPLFRQH